MLTLSLWFSSFVLIAASFVYTKEWNDNATLLNKLLRAMFCIMVGMSFWTISTYLLWVIGFKLKIGIIQNGKMESHWWLPFLVIAWTCATYFAAKPKTDFK